MEADGLQLRESAERVSLGEERQRRCVPRVAPTIRLPCVFFLQPRGVGQYETAQIGRSRRAEDAAAEPLRDEAWQVAGVIEVSVCQDDRMDRRRVDRQAVQFRSRSDFNPWNRPQSTSSRVWSVSSRYFEPVTVSGGPEERESRHPATIADRNRAARRWCAAEVLS